ncbi:MAG TPA: acyl-CoA thioesterase II [Pseudonocardia sp.]|jgi:acyl-CoA thioesterase-2|uniref:acyl-CoA thioesterase n=1 Tax=Pseudonocardia sp. Cha107L01 TaxID=3457576 RepID=UPI0028CA1D89|nr:acyl-CoA thioesterase [Pseudonocardia sp.]MDT7558329.1 acyl-CoA thioesterase [Pseudonocardiales bacterium]MDT7619422.1 acyl-CoA thioesterase [Pseudonocardiales bacterium]MDT7647242.1 acyl-CoA thioesterase [Pseudonocardiales bacterium]MDT7662345.1 acyl-CoA thioesterase [Pseudonocardiales bacterium]
MTQSDTDTGAGGEVVGADGVPTGQAVLDALVAGLDLERIEVNLFRGHSPPRSLPRVFGGQVAGQALVAAGRTVPVEREVHSLHAYFIRPGDPTVPIVYEVERVRDGFSFTTRRVLAIQHGEAIFSLSASFQVHQPGLEHSEEMPTGVPTPDELPDMGTRIVELGAAVGPFQQLPRPLDIRYVGDPVWSPGFTPTREPMRVWMRADGTLPDTKLLHVCLLTYASDLTLLNSVLARHEIPVRDEEIRRASLDHAMWFHQPFRADEWLLYECYSPVASGARGLGTGRFFTQDGRLVATTVQEGLVRIAAR